MLKAIKDNFPNNCLVFFGNKKDLGNQRDVNHEEIKKFVEENGLKY